MTTGINREKCYIASSKGNRSPQATVCHQVLSFSSILNTKVAVGCISRRPHAFLQSHSQPTFVQGTARYKHSLHKLRDSSRHKIVTPKERFYPSNSISNNDNNTPRNCTISNKTQVREKLKTK